MTTYQDVIRMIHAGDYETAEDMIAEVDARLTDAQCDDLRLEMHVRRLLADIPLQCDLGDVNLRLVTERAVRDAGTHAAELTGRDIVDIIREAEECQRIEREQEQ